MYQYYIVKVYYYNFPKVNWKIHNREQALSLYLYIFQGAITGVSESKSPKNNTKCQMKTYCRSVQYRLIIHMIVCDQIGRF